jgi:hypothetical protein
VKSLRPLLALCDADLRRIDLESADLSGANLSGAVLSFADLNHADLIGANLRGTNLSGANLSGADLSIALNLTREQLDDACGDATTKLPKGFKPLKPCSTNVQLSHAAPCVRALLAHLRHVGCVARCPL